MTGNWTTHIKAKTGIFEIDIREILKYRDLIWILVKRNFVTRYKQTVLGPLWVLITPLITVLLHSFVFGSIAGLSTDGSPQLLFYMASNTIWTYFAFCVNKTAVTFTENAGLFGKVYFPRLIVPIATVITGLIDLFIQMGLFLIMIAIYEIQGVQVGLNEWLFMIPIIIIQTAVLGLGVGITISSVTTKYRDLTILVSFGMQLWMYASPTVYSLSEIPESWRNIYLLNPLAPIITIWRYAFLGTGTIPVVAWGISWCITIVMFFIGVLLFNKVEKTFMDTV